jgi:hypothetical protein
MPINGNRPGKGAAHSVGEFSNAAESTRQPATTQADIAGDFPESLRRAAP